MLHMKKYLQNRWGESGLKKGDNILLHSSLKRTFKDMHLMGYNVTALDVLESFIDLIGPEGTLLIPTFNFDFNKNIPYDYYSTKSQMGTMTEVARVHVDGKRSVNPVYSFVAFGKNKELFHDIENISWYSNESPFALAHQLNFKICIIDLSDHNSMTFVHYCEEINKVPWRIFKNFTGTYTNRNYETSTKTFKGYVRNISKGIITNVDPAGELMWEKGIYHGSRPFVGNGLRFVFANDYFNLFNELLNQEKSRPYYYDVV